MDMMEFDQKITKRIHGYGLTIPKKMFEAYNFAAGERVTVTVAKDGKEQVYSCKILLAKSQKPNKRLYVGYYIHLPKHCVNTGILQHEDLVHVTIEKSRRGVRNGNTD